MEDILSIVSICRNEADIIQRFFDSIHQKLGKNIEVVLVDTGSTDDTVAIARKNGAKVIEVGDRFEWRYDVKTVMYINLDVGVEIVRPGDRVFFFDQARNEATKHATKPWCLSMDISQVIENINVDNLRQELQTTNADTFFIDLILETAKMSTSRIYRRDIGVWRYPVHELIYGNVYGTTNNILLNHIRRADDRKNYMPMVAYMYYMWKRIEPHDEPRLEFYFARDLFYLKHMKQARRYLEKVFLNPKHWNKERSEASCLWAETYTKDNDPNWLQKRRIGYNRAVSIFPGWRRPYIGLCEVCAFENDWLGVIAYVDQMLKIPSQELVPIHIENGIFYTFVPYQLKYRALINMTIIQSQAGINPGKTIEEYLDIEPKTNFEGAPLFPGWELAFKYYMQTGNKDKGQYYISKLLKYNPSYLNILINQPQK